MKKSTKSHKIHTNKHIVEKNKKVQELVKKLQIDQMKNFLRKYYKYVQEYDPEIVMEALDKQWVYTQKNTKNSLNSTLITSENDNSIQTYDPFSDAPINTKISQGFRHNPKDTLKRNAAFLIESSEKIGYNQEVLFKMKKSFDLGEYDDVLDLACLYDREQRQVTRPAINEEEDIKAAKKALQDDEKNWTQRLVDLISEVELESSEDTTITHYLTCALHEMDGELTYDSRSMARDYIKKALQSENT